MKLSEVHHLFFLTKTPITVHQIKTGLCYKCSTIYNNTKVKCNTLNTSYIKTMLYYKCSTFIYNSIKVILCYFILKNYSYRVVPRKIRVVGDLVWLPSVGGSRNIPRNFFTFYKKKIRKQIWTKWGGGGKYWVKTTSGGRHRPPRGHPCSYLKYSKMVYNLSFKKIEIKKKIIINNLFITKKFGKKKFGNFFLGAVLGEDH